jgi:hypothetical protein
MSNLGEFVKFDRRVNSPKVSTNFGKFLVTGVNLCAAKFTVTGQIFWTKVRINAVCYPLPASSGLDFKLFTFEDIIPTIPFIQICLQCFHFVTLYLTEEVSIIAEFGFNVNLWAYRFVWVDGEGSKYYNE